MVLRNYRPTSHGEFEHESQGMYAPGDATMTYLRQALENFTEEQRVKFFTWLTGLPAAWLTVGTLDLRFAEDRA